MKNIGSFISRRWGKVKVFDSRYGNEKGPLAIQLVCKDGKPLATLSVNMYKPECSHDSRDLPPDCFYVKDWSENEAIAEEARKSGLFLCRDDLPIARSGFVTAEVWQVKS